MFPVIKNTSLDVQRWLSLLAAAVLMCILVACSSASIETPTPQPLSDELILYDWADDLPQSVIDTFTEKYGVTVTYLTYDSQEEAYQNLEDGGVYDVVVIENDFIPLLTADGLLAEIDYRNVPNFKNIQPDFRELLYDPGNHYSIPFNWGTTGLIVRSDLVEEMPTHWADLWESQYAGRIGIRKDIPLDFIGATLKSLGYSINSEEPAELEAALARMLEIRDEIVFVGPTSRDAALKLSSGEVVILIGWAEDIWKNEGEDVELDYAFPEEGTMLWGDSFVIPATSPNKYAAELFINFLLQPEISAAITNENYYATANEAAHVFVNHEVLNDPLVYPSAEDLKYAEVFLPHTAEGEALYAEIWEKFLAGRP
jgi:spermidine/putrescine transport system substrate-binding protein